MNPARRTRRRRSVGGTVTEERIRETGRSLDRLFGESWYSLPPPADAQEEIRRRRAIQGGVQRALLGALLYLREHHPAVAGAIVLAGRDYSEQALRGDRPSFAVKQVTKQPVPAWIRHPGVIGTHRRVVKELRGAWIAPIAQTTVRSPRYVSNKVSFGEAQMHGTARYHARVRQRVQAVVRVFKALAEEAGIERRPPTERTARQWVVESRTPARVSYRVVGALLRKSPRVVKKMLDEAGQYLRMAEEQHRILDLWGWARFSEEPVNPTESSTDDRPNDASRR